MACFFGVSGFGAATLAAGRGAGFAAAFGAALAVAFGAGFAAASGARRALAFGAGFAATFGAAGFATARGFAPAFAAAGALGRARGDFSGSDGRALRALGTLRCGAATLAAALARGFGVSLAPSGAFGLRAICASSVTGPAGTALRESRWRSPGAPARE